MYTGLLHSHRSLAYLLLISAIATVIVALVNRLENRPSSKALNALTILTLVLSHLQLLMGLSIYYIGPWFGMLTTNTAEVMRDPDLRWFAVEHMSVNLIGIALVTVGRIRFKKLESDRRSQQAVVAYMGLGLLLIASRVPWERLF